MHKTVFIFMLLLACLSATGSEEQRGNKSSASCPVVEMQVEQLPDMSVPRLGHAVFYINDELVAIGGHTTGFVPTPTAEHLKDGKWETVSLPYAHDDACCVLLPSGKLLLAAGMEKPLGIGQTFMLDIYNPATHTVDSYGCMDSKRAFPSALSIGNDSVIITGSWYADDGIEMYDGTPQNRTVKAVSQQRSLPYILRTAPDNAIIFG